MSCIKRAVSVFLSVVLTIGIIPLSSMEDLSSLFTTTAKASNIAIDGIPYYGDVDENGSITAADARKTLRVAAKLETFNSRQLQLADIDKNGAISASDARATLRMAARLDPLIIFDGDTVTRGDALSAIYKNIGFSGFDAKEPYFNDVSEDSPYYECVQSAVEWGIIEDGDLFYPDAAATEEFIVSAVMKASSLADEEDSAEAAAAKAVECGIVDAAPSADASANANNLVSAIENAKKTASEQELENTENVELADALKDFSDFEEEDIAQTSETAYTFSSALAPAEGDVFISPATDEYPGGRARKITDITENEDGTVTVETETPELDEIFDEFSFSDTVEFDSDEMEFTPAAGIEVSDGIQSYSADEEEKSDKIFSCKFQANSGGEPFYPFDMSLKTSSDYFDALNSSKNFKDKSFEKTVTDYNVLIKNVDKNGNIKSDNVKKYNSEWQLTAALAIDSIKLKCDFKDFWKKGEYSLQLISQINVNAEYNGSVAKDIKIGTVHITKWYVKFFANYDVDMYLHLEANGDVTVTATLNIDQSFTGTLGERCKHLDNNNLDAKFNAGLTALAALQLKPHLEVFGIGLAEMNISTGMQFNASFSGKAAVKYKDKIYNYEGNFDKLPDGVGLTVQNCLDAKLYLPIITVTVQAGEDVVKWLEKQKKKHDLNVNIPTEYTFEICTLSKDAFMNPIPLDFHFEDGEFVDKCHADEIKTLAHFYSGRVVDESKNSVAGADIVMKDSSGAVVSTTVSDEQGEFELKLMPYGTYMVDVTYNDNTTSFEDIKIEKAETDGGDFEIKQNNWQKAYTEFVKSTHESNMRFALAYIDNDEIPELLILYTDNFSGIPEIGIYNYKNNKVTKLASFLEHDFSLNLALKKNSFFVEWNQGGTGTYMSFKHISSSSQITNDSDFICYNNSEFGRPNEYVVNNRTVSYSEYQRILNDQKKGYQFVSVDDSGGFTANSINIGKIINDPDAVTIKENNWQEAYTESLNKNASSRSKFCLVYFDEDNIPELAVAEDGAHYASVDLYGYKSGKVNKICTTGVYGTMFFVQKQGILCMENMNMGYCSGSYKQYVDGQENTLLSWWHDEYSATGHTAPTYEINGNKVSKSTYETKLKEMNDKYQDSLTEAAYYMMFDANSVNTKKIITNPDTVTIK